MSKISDWWAEITAKLDGWGKGAWIATMVVAFILFWPLGLFILGYMIWSGRMGCKSMKSRRHRWTRSTGNTVFDDYREETLRRLEDEQSAFEGFLEKLRKAKDKAEFDQFMDDRRRGGTEADPQPAA